MGNNMDFKLEAFNRNTDESLLLEDLQRVNKLLEKSGKNVTFRDYNELGKYSSATISARFGGWNKGLVKAGISPSMEKDIDEKKLFDNLKEVWIHKGGQPVFRDMAKRPSKYTAGVYNSRYGGWRKALEAFVGYYNSDNKEIIEEQEREEQVEEIKNPKKKRRTSRHISERMRFSILLRDGFRCQSCGKSPVKSPGIELHVDHILPWSKGGETIPENLQTKCKECNLGKGNAFDK
jgi:hypothetical protein